MDIKKVLIIVLVLIIGIILINESRFLIWGAYGVPEQSSGPNCGENRYKYDVRINSEAEFLNLIDTWKNKTSSDVGQEAFNVMQWFRSSMIKLDEISVRTSGSLINSKKIYSVPLIGPACNMVLEISEDGYASTKGCCGI
jgi:hypothetical protein